MEDQPVAGSGVSAVSGVQAQPKPAQLLTIRKSLYIFNHSITLV